MNEEEIIKEINIIKETIIGILKIDTENYIEDIYNIDTKQFKAILGLLDLYNKEKEKNKKIEDKIKGKINNLEIFKKALPIRATEIERFIGELKDLLEE